MSDTDTQKNLTSPGAKELVTHALGAREKAAAPYSSFPVGAALEDSTGKVWTGCNVESSSYGLSCCAERVALFKAISEGVRDFHRIAIVAGGEGIATPCGACRQVMHDYAPGLDVILYNPDNGEAKELPLSDLIPLPFDDGNFKGKA